MNLERENRVMREEWKQYIEEHTKRRNRLLVLMACHCDTDVKFVSVLNNLRYFEGHDVVVVNSANLPANLSFKTILKDKIWKYMEVENHVLRDFGKWEHALRVLDRNEYDRVVLTNDSYFMDGPITSFLERGKNVDLYAYNSSTEHRYHYQSFLFSVRSTKVDNLLELIDQQREFIRTPESLIEHIELSLMNAFIKRDCFLDLGAWEGTNSCNIFFYNDVLYKALRQSGLFPFIKLKRVFFWCRMPIFTLRS